MSKFYVEARTVYKVVDSQSNEVICQCALEHVAQGICDEKNKAAAEVATEVKEAGKRNEL